MMHKKVLCHIFHTKLRGRLFYLLLKGDKGTTKIRERERERERERGRGSHRLTTDFGGLSISVNSVANMHCYAPCSTYATDLQS